MKRGLAAEIDNLYRLPLGEFTTARNALSKTLSGSEKKQVSSLVKPSLPMWAVNQLYWQDAPTYNALIDASEKLRAAHRSILSGRKGDTRQSDQLHRATVDKAFAKAMAIAEKSGVRLTSAVRETIRRVLAALPGEEPAGHLTRPPEPAGFSLLTGIKPRPAAVRSVRETSGKVALERQARKQAAAARKAQEKARKEEEKRERAIRKAEQALRDAERRLTELKR